METRERARHGKGGGGNAPEGGEERARETRHEHAGLPELPLERLLGDLDVLARLHDDLLGLGGLLELLEGPVHARPAGEGDVEAERGPETGADGDVRADLLGGLLQRLAWVVGEREEGDQVRCCGASRYRGCEGGGGEGEQPSAPRRSEKGTTARRSLPLRPFQHPLARRAETFRKEIQKDGPVRLGQIPGKVRFSELHVLLAHGRTDEGPRRGREGRGGGRQPPAEHHPSAGPSREEEGRGPTDLLLLVHLVGHRSDRHAGQGVERGSLRGGGWRWSEETTGVVGSASGSLASGRMTSTAQQAPKERGLWTVVAHPHVRCARLSSSLTNGRAEL